MLAGIFVYAPWLALVNLLLLVAYVSVIPFATRGPAIGHARCSAGEHSLARFRLGDNGGGLQLAAVAVVWFLIIPPDPFHIQKDATPLESNQREPSKG